MVRSIIFLSDSVPPSPPKLHEAAILVVADCYIDFGAMKPS